MAQAVEAEFSPHEQRVFVKAREEKGRNKKQRWSCRSNPMENRKQNDQERRWKLNKRQLKRKEGMEKGDWEGLAAAGIYLGVYTKTVWESSTAKLKGFEKNVFPKIYFFLEYCQLQSKLQVFDLKTYISPSSNSDLAWKYEHHLTCWCFDQKAALGHILWWISQDKTGFSEPPLKTLSKILSKGGHNEHVQSQCAIPNYKAYIYI